MSSKKIFDLVIFVVTIGIMEALRNPTHEQRTLNLVSEFPEDNNAQITTAEPLHVVIVSESPLSHASGVTTSVKKMAEYLPHEGHKVTVVCPDPAPESHGEAEVIATKSSDLNGLASMPVGIMSTKKFRKLFEKLGPSVVHVASPMSTPKDKGLFLGGSAVSAANQLDIPIAAVYQTNAPAFAKDLKLGLSVPAVEKIIERIHSKADINLSPSTSADEDLIRWGVDGESISRWTRGVDTELFTDERRSSSAVAELREHLAPNGETIVGVVCRLEPEKSLHKLEILKDIPETKMLIIGKGEKTRKKLEKMLGKAATFTGRLNGEDLANGYAAIDVFPYPSVTDTFAQVVQEAKASGIPVVAANKGGPRDLIAHGVNGYLYEPGDKEGADLGLYYYVRKLVEEPALRKKMSQAARSSVEEYTWEKHGEQIVKYYREAIERRKSKPTNFEQT